MTIAQLIEEILLEAWKGSEQLKAFEQAFRDKVPVPCEGSIAAEPVTVLQFDFDGSERRGLTAKVQRIDRRTFILSAADIAFPPRTPGARYVAAYRQWIGAGAIVKPRPPVAKPAKPVIRLRCPAVVPLTAFYLLLPHRRWSQQHNLPVLTQHSVKNHPFSEPQALAGSVLGMFDICLRHLSLKLPRLL